MLTNFSAKEVQATINEKGDKYCCGCKFKFWSDSAYRPKVGPFAVTTSHISCRSPLMTDISSQSDCHNLPSDQMSTMLTHQYLFKIPTSSIQWIHKYKYSKMINVCPNL